MYFLSLALIHNQRVAFVPTRII